MPGIEPQTDRKRCPRRVGKLCQHTGLVRGAKGTRPGLCVELDTVCPDGTGGGHGLWNRVHEQADPHPQGMSLIDQRLETPGILRKAPTMVTGELAFAVGHKGGLVRAKLAHKVHQVVEWIALDVELCLWPLLEQGGQVAHITGTDVALIRAGG